MQAAGATQAVERERLTWEAFGVGARELAQTVDADGYRPDAVLAIARGGLVIGGALAYALGVKPSYLVNVEYYTGEGQTMEAPVVLPAALNLDAASDARVLIADDVADSGHTLQVVHDLARSAVAEVRTAVLYEKPRSAVACDYVWKRTDAWIDFPWSSGSALVSEGARP
ncbi:phosphoribosyltransferase [Egibacter rhizosphaerae]|uniref:Phosphoribosyltransferase n=1 Tax=Egibacter rhizosphaerae TaxID=1670831 RepID=A0A411YLR1_9ACTN|nr:phosphoribosyltransferase [Egibacter rhizosphaerae]